jgi:hypothetical protein
MERAAGRRHAVRRAAAETGRAPSRPARDRLLTQLVAAFTRRWYTPGVERDGISGPETEAQVMP